MAQISQNVRILLILDLLDSIALFIKAVRGFNSENVNDITRKILNSQINARRAILRCLWYGHIQFTLKSLRTKIRHLLERVSVYCLVLNLVRTEIYAGRVQIWT